MLSDIAHESDHSDMPGLRMLARAVIEQAFEDAFWTRKTDCGGFLNRQDIVRARAQMWLMSGEYYPWDQAAGIHHDEILARFEQLYATLN